jgi:hypothetical protein
MEGYLKKKTNPDYYLSKQTINIVIFTNSRFYNYIELVNLAVVLHT